MLIYPADRPSRRVARQTLHAAGLFTRQHERLRVLKWGSIFDRAVDRMPPFLETVRWQLGCAWVQLMHAYTVLVAGKGFYI